EAGPDGGELSIPVQRCVPALLPVEVEAVQLRVAGHQSAAVGVEGGAVDVRGDGDSRTQIDQSALLAAAADERVGVPDGLPRGLASLSGREAEVCGGAGPESSAVEVLTDEFLTVGEDEVAIEEGEDAR